MKADIFIDAMGMIDDKYLVLNQTTKPTSKLKISRRFTAVAAAAALILLPLPVSTAFGSDPAYNILYHIAPSVAQTFKPVQRSCTDKDIEMTVISADISENKASVYLAMHDLTGKYPGGYWDLYDSYDINVRRDMVGNCSFSEYDDETATAYFVVNLETMDGSDIPASKVTFSVSEMLFGRLKTEDYLTDIDLDSIPYEPDTVSSPENVNGQFFYREMKEAADYRFLPIPKDPVAEPAKDAAIMNIGYIDGALHVLCRYNNVSETDSHGFVSLRDNNGTDVFDKTAFGFCYRAEDPSSSYVEEIIPVAYEDLGNYRLYGEFYTTQEHITGDWEVTFRLK